MTTKSTKQADNITMSGGGLYSLATIGAKDVIDNATPSVLSALNSIQKPDGAHWCFSDMGCADGGTSLSLWANAIKQLRLKNDDDIQIVYADQTGNDFNALVQILHGNTQFESYLPTSDNVTVMESGASFYTPILPKNTLHLGFSATAMHWLSQKPCNIANHVHMVGAKGDDLKKFQRQAANDWQNILIHRARELKSGGKLVLVNFCIDEHGQYLGNTGGVNMFNNFNSIWQQFLENNTITESEYAAMTLPQYYNTVEEFSAPLLDSASDAYKAGLRLVDIETAVIACPFAEDFKQHQDAAKFAKEYIPTIRSWNESIFFGALNSDRPIAERQQLIENYYGQYEQQVRDAPEGHGMGYVHAYMTIEKI